MKRVVIIGIFLVLMAGPALAGSFTGKVVRVIDGDTVSVSCSSCQKKFHKVRLAEIDAPEKKQAFGAESTKALSDKVLGKTVVVEWNNKGRYGRIIGTIYTADRNINEEMIKSGLAWRYVQYSKSKHLFALEQQAREQGKGLWKNPAAIAPWDFRKIPK